MVFWRKKLPPLDIDPADMSSAAEEFMVSSSVAFVQKYAQTCEDYGFDDVHEWHSDQDTAKFTATTRKGKYVADVEMIATWHVEDATWEWAWSNPYVDDRVKADANRIKAYGEIKRIKCLACEMSKLPEDLEEARQLTMVMMGMALEIATSECIFFGISNPYVYHLGLKNIQATWLRPPTLG